MKKTITGLLLAVILIAPSFAHAQVSDTQYRSLVDQLIAMLTQQVIVLQGQLADLQKKEEARSEREDREEKEDNTGNSEDPTDEEVDFEVAVFEFSRDASRQELYYRGNKEISASSISLSKSDVSFKEVSSNEVHEDSCVNTVDYRRVCGGYSMTFEPVSKLSEGEYKVSFESEDGDEEKATITVSSAE